MTALLLILLGAAVGAAAVCALLLPRARATAVRLSVERDAAQDRIADLQRATEEKLQLVMGSREQLVEQMKAISADVLQKTTQQAAQLAEAQRRADREVASGELARRTTEFQKSVAPLETHLARLAEQVKTLEAERQRTQGSIGQMMRSMSDELGKLRSETGSLVSALKRPQVRGSWGEMQLRNAVEAANMTEHVDFVMQQTLDAGIDGRLRPDMIVHLPGGGQVVVDSKVPMDAYLQALEEADEVQQVRLLDRHAAQLKTHIDQLSSKAYHAQFRDNSPDFVVCFVPNEAVYCAALERQPTLLEHGAAKDVLIATPMSLLALLKAVSYGWRQERIAESAREIADAARELHKRVCTFLEPFAKVGRSLNTTVNAYNQATSSLEARVLPQLRRMEQAGAGSAKELTAPAPVETPARLLAAAELGAGRPAGRTTSRTAPAGAPAAGARAGDRQLDREGDVQQALPAVREAQAQDDLPPVREAA